MKIGMKATTTEKKKNCDGDDENSPKIKFYLSWTSFQLATQTYQFKAKQGKNVKKIIYFIS